MRRGRYERGNKLSNNLGLDFFFFFFKFGPIRADLNGLRAYSGQINKLEFYSDH